MLVADLVAGVLLATLLVGPLVHFLVPRGPNGARTGVPESVGVALGGLAVGGLVNVLFGWIPLLGAFAAPVAWVGVIRWSRTVDWPTAVGVGFLSWAIATVTLAFTGMLVGVVA